MNETPTGEAVVCGPCSLDVHDDCHRHDGEPCACPGDDDQEPCGARLRVFEGSNFVIFCGCCEPDGTHDHTRCEHPCCLNFDNFDEESDTAEAPGLRGER